MKILRTESYGQSVKFATDILRLAPKTAVHHQYYGWLSAVGFNYKLNYKPRDHLFLSLVEMTTFKLERMFQSMRALKFTTDYMALIKSYS